MVGDISTAIEARYAEALLKALINDTEKNSNTHDEIIVSCSTLLKTIIENRELLIFLSNERIEKDKRYEVLSNILSSDVDNRLLNFFKLLIDKNRIYLLEGIYREFLKLSDEYRNIVFAEIRTPFELEENEKELIKKKIKKEYNANDVRLEIIEDKSIVGGVKIKIEDTIVDYTVDGILARMLDTLIER